MEETKTVFKVGKIVQYGRTNHDTGRLENYGFIKPYGEGGERIFFHRNNVIISSFPNGEIEEGIPVIYTNDNVDKKGRNFAENVKNAFRLTNTEQNLIDPDMKSLAINDVEHPEIFLGKDMEPYFFHLYIDSVRRLFERRVEENYFDDDIYKCFKQFLQKGTMGWRVNPFWKSLPFQTWSKEQILEIIDIAYKKGIPGQRYLQIVYYSRFPETWLTRNSVILSAIALLLFEMLDYGWKPDKQHVDLIMSAPEFNDVRVSFIRRLTVSDFGLKLDEKHIRYILSTPEFSEVRGIVVQNLARSGTLLVKETKYIDYWSESMFIERIEKIDFKLHTENNSRNTSFIINKLDTKKYPVASLKLCERFYEQDLTDQIRWWNYLSDEIKVRFCIFFSCDLCFMNIEPFEKLTDFIMKDPNEIVRGLAHMLKCAFCSEEERKDYFIAGHDLILHAIANMYLDSYNISNDIFALCDKCMLDDNVLCCARKDKKKNVIYCNTKKRGECSFFSNMDLNITKYKATNDSSKQTFSDFLQNMGLVNLGYEKPLEVSQNDTYSHRITAYVYRLNELKDVLKCEYCGQVMRPQFEYAKKVNALVPLTVFDCVECGELHDKGVYLNYCRNGKCRIIIDSRKCKIQDENGYWLCMRCGTGSESTSSGSRCPNCGEWCHFSKSGKNVCEKCKYVFYKI